MKSTDAVIFRLQSASLLDFHQSSESKKATHSPLAALIPKFLDTEIDPPLLILKVLILLFI